VAQGRVQLARDECDSENLDAAARAHERMDTLIADLLTLAREGERVSETESVRLSVVVESSWGRRSRPRMRRWPSRRTCGSGPTRAASDSSSRIWCGTRSNTAATTC